LLRINLGYPEKDQEIDILDSQQYQHPIDTLDQVVDEKELLAAQESLKEVYVDQLIKQYIVEIVSQTRRHPEVYLGASPRGSLTLYRAAQAYAAIRGRDYVIPDEIKVLAPFALAHRMIVSPAARIKDVSSEAVLADILASVPVPGARVVRG
jgi:MoxR-like ATPase